MTAPASSRSASQPASQPADRHQPAICASLFNSSTVRRRRVIHPSNFNSLLLRRAATIDRRIAYLISTSTRRRPRNPPILQSTRQATLGRRIRYSHGRVCARPDLLGLLSPCHCSLATQGEIDQSGRSQFCPGSAFSPHTQDGWLQHCHSPQPRRRTRITRTTTSRLPLSLVWAPPTAYPLKIYDTISCVHVYDAAASLLSPQLSHSSRLFVRPYQAHRSGRPPANTSRPRILAARTLVLETDLGSNTAANINRPSWANRPSQK